MGSEWRSRAISMTTLSPRGNQANLSPYPPRLPRPWHCCSSLHTTPALVRKCSSSRNRVRSRCASTRALPIAPDQTRLAEGRTAHAVSKLRIPNTRPARSFHVAVGSLATSDEASAVAPVELPSVSVIIPVFNEVQSIAIVIERVGDVLMRNGWPHEIICVDDGSTDGSIAMLKCIAAEKPEVRVVILQRNFGQTAAFSAGFDYAAGDIVVTLDADLQNDPADIPRLLDCLVFGDSSRESAEVSLPPLGPASSSSSSSTWSKEREDGGYDLVCGWRKDRKDDAVLRNFPSYVANALIGWLTGVKLHDYGCSLKAYRASLVRSFRIYGELHRFLPSLAASEGASICEVPVTHHPRRTGQSKYGLSRIPRVLVDLSLVLFIKQFRDRPMHFFGAVAALPLAASATFFVLFLLAIFRAAPAYGWAMALSVATPHLVASLQFLTASLLLFSLGIVADLCMRTYYESQDRPVYRVREITNG